MVAMATRTGLEPVFSGVTGRRDNQLHQRAIFRSCWSLICVYLEFRRLRVFSLIRPQLPGDSDGFRSHYLQRDRLALSRLSYKAKLPMGFALPYPTKQSALLMARISPVCCRSHLPSETTGGNGCSTQSMVGVMGLEPTRPYEH